MRNKTIKITILALQLVIMAFVIGICIEGCVYLDSFNDSLKYAETIMRCVALISFAIIYNMYMSSDAGPDSLFIPLFMLFFTISETRIFETFTEDFSLIIIEPMSATIIFLFSVLGMMSSLIGYCLFYSNRDVASIYWFQFAAIIGSLVFAMILPKVPDYYNVISIFPTKIFIYILSALAMFVAIIQLLKDHDRNDRIRHLAIIFLILGSFLNVLYDSIIMNITATLFLAVGLLFITLILKFNDVKF